MFQIFKKQPDNIVELIHNEFDNILGSMIVNRNDLTGLMIAAPKSKFDLTDVDMKSKFSYAKSAQYRVDDPIVFRYCRGGIQVISKWGKEAEAVTLPIEN